MKLSIRKILEGSFLKPIVHGMGWGLLLVGSGAILIPAKVATVLAGIFLMLYSKFLME